MRARFSVAIVCLTTLVLSGVARAGTGNFGGFSRDETRYLRGPDQVCVPFAAGKTVRGFPSCERVSPEVVASFGFRKGTLQTGATARYRVRVAKAKAICVFDAGSGKKAAGWASVDSISRISAVRSSDSGRLLAVEYEARVTGRATTDVVVFSMPVSGASPDPASKKASTHEPTAGSEASGDGPSAPSPEVAGHIEEGWKLVRQGRHARAAARFEKALGLAPSSPEARYGLAVTLAQRGKGQEAIAELMQLSGPNAVVWQVEARFDKAFRKLYGNRDFRKATGLDRPVSEQSAYERLVGQGGTWEQSGTPCDRARVNLTLKRRPREFVMKIRTRCQGLDETTRLDGRWGPAGDPASGGLELTFPNVDGPEEVMRCALSACADGSGEDCLTCAAGTDMEMSFRTVRR